MKEKSLEMPHDLNAEKSVLANLMYIDADKTRETVDLLNPNDFYIDTHKDIYRSIKLLGEGCLDTVAVSNHLRMKQKISHISTDYLLDLFESRSGSLVSLEHHAKIVHEFSLLRQIIETGDRMKQLAINYSGSIDDTIAKCAQDLEDLQGSIKPKTVKSRTFDELLTADFPELEYLIFPMIRITNQIIIHAGVGVGKTHFANELGYMVATGGSCFGWNAPKARSVLIVDGEMSLRDIKVRYQALHQRNKGEPGNNFNIMSFSDFEDDINLIRPQWQAMVNQKIEEVNAELVVFDNLDSLFAVDQNKQVEWMPAQIWLKRLRQKGVATILIHHSNKQKQAFGTTAVSRNPDLILALNHPDDYNAEEGAVFDVKVDKARELRNEYAATFRCKLTDDGWEISESPISVYGAKKAIIESMRDGNSHFKDIASDLDKSPSTVKSQLTGLIKDGLVVKLGKGKYELADLPASVPSLNQSNSQSQG